MHVINNPSIPFWGHIPHEVRPGLVIQVDGHIPHFAERFDINLVKGQEVGHHASHNSTIALHLNPRVAEDYIVLNSRHHKSWGSEERHRHTHHLHRGSNFSITIHVEHEYYRISVNGSHLANFHHRMALHEVGTLFIDGNVEVRTIEYRKEYEHTGHYTPAYQTTYVSPINQPVYVPPTNVFVPAHYEDQSHHHHHDQHHHGHQDHHHGHHNY